MSEWTDAAIALPDVSGWYLGYFEDKLDTDHGHFYGTVAFIRGEFLLGSGNRASGIFQTLTHWAPLPKPPNVQKMDKVF